MSCGCESWILNNGDEERIRAFKVLGLRHILRVSWTAKRTNQWILQKSAVTRSLLEAIKKRKLTYFGHTMKKHDSLEKDIITGTLPGKRARGRLKTSWMNNIIT